MPSVQSSLNKSNGQRLQGLPPILGPDTRVLILGSFPGIASLQAQQYYAHPQNQFWRLLQALWPAAAMPADYVGRGDWLLARGLGVWDVYASCERHGSLDSAIRNAELNDFSSLQRQCPMLQLLAHNGGESFRHAARVRACLGSDRHAVIKLPSTSPANASWRFERKLQAWREALADAGVL